MTNVERKVPSSEITHKNMALQTRAGSHSDASDVDDPSSSVFLTLALLILVTYEAGSLAMPEEIFQ
jgi:hypothetical protein